MNSWTNPFTQQLERKPFLPDYEWLVFPPQRTAYETTFSFTWRTPRAVAVIKAYLKPKFYGHTDTCGIIAVESPDDVQWLKPPRPKRIP